MSLLNRASNLIWAMEPGALEQMFSVLGRTNLKPEEAMALYEERWKRFNSDVDGFEFGAVQAQPGERVAGTRLARKREPESGIIAVIGPIVRRADFFTEISGATSIETLARDFNTVLADDSIKQVVFYIDSPGGEVNGIHEFAQMVYESRSQKPIRAYAAGMCCSGAYWIASACERITADATAMIGSVGVRAVLLDDSRALESAGIDRISIVSSNAPKKDFKRDDAQSLADCKARIDAVETVFIETIARNRGTSAEVVKANYGQGGVLIGQAAVTAGMVDALGSFEQGLLEMTGNVDALPEPPASPLESGTNTGGSNSASDSNGGRKMSWIKDLYNRMTAEEKKEVHTLAGDSTGQQSAGQSSGSPAQSVTLVEGAAVIQPSPQVAAMQAELDRIKAERHQERLDQIAKDAETFYTAQFGAHTVLPAQKAQVIEDYTTAATDDLLYPVKAEAGQTAPKTRVQKLNERYAAMPKHRYTQEAIGGTALYGLNNANSAPDPLAEAQKDAEAYADQRNKANSRAQVGQSIH